MSWKEKSIEFIFESVYVYIPDSIKKRILSYKTMATSKVTHFSQANIRDNKIDLKKIIKILLILILLSSALKFKEIIIIFGYLLICTSLMVNSLNYLEDFSNNIKKDINITFKYIIIFAPFIYIFIFLHNNARYNLSLQQTMIDMTNNIDENTLFKALLYSTLSISSFLLIKLIIFVFSPTCLLIIIKKILINKAAKKTIQGVIWAYICRKLASYI